MLKMTFLQEKNGTQKRVQNISLNMSPKSLAQNYVKKYVMFFYYFTIFVSLMNGPYILSPCRNPLFQSTLPADPSYPNLSASVKKKLQF